MKQKENQLMIRLMGLSRGLTQSTEGLSLKGRMTEEDNLNLSHDRQMMRNLG
jgi:hypothetical protein